MLLVIGIERYYLGTNVWAERIKLNIVNVESSYKD